MTEIKVESCLNSLSQAFTEIAETKAGLTTLASTCQQCLSEQLQKFSVLAYDYVDRLDTLARREAHIDEKMREQHERAERFKSVA